MKRILNTLKYRFMLTLTVLLTVGTLSAQEDKPPFSPEEFRERLEGFIIKESKLTPEEAKVVFPMFHDMRSKQREVMDQISKLKRSHTAMADDQACSALISKITALKIKAAKIEHEYYTNMCKMVPGRKIYSVMKAEDKFHRNIFKRFNHGKNKPKGRKQ